MNHPQSTVFISVRLTLAQKGKLLAMGRKAGDPNPSTTVRRIIFGERRSPEKIRISKGLPRYESALRRRKPRAVTRSK